MEGGEPHPTVLTEDDIFTAWEVISPSGHSVLTKSQVLDSLKMFIPDISAREVRNLVGPGNLSVEKLKDLLFKTHTPGSDFSDANWEAFRIIDPHGTGYVEMNVLKRLLLHLPGVDMINEADMEFLYQLVDIDKDERISFRDFAQIGSWCPPKEIPNDAIRALMFEKLQIDD